MFRARIICKHIIVMHYANNSSNLHVELQAEVAFGIVFSKHPYHKEEMWLDSCGYVPFLTSGVTY
jgi:hypothetical protein